MRASVFRTVAALAAAAVAAPSMLSAQAADEWSAYDRDAAGTRSAPLTQVTPDNVRHLAPLLT